MPECHFVGHDDDVYNGLVCNGTICGLAVRPGGCQSVKRRRGARMRRRNGRKRETKRG